MRDYLAFAFAAVVSISGCGKESPKPATPAASISPPSKPIEPPKPTTAPTTELICNMKSKLGMTLDMQLSISGSPEKLYVNNTLQDKADISSGKITWEDKSNEVLWTIDRISGKIEGFSGKLATTFTSGLCTKTSDRKF